MPAFHLKRTAILRAALFTAALAGGGTLRGEVFEIELPATSGRFAEAPVRITAPESLAAETAFEVEESGTALRLPAQRIGATEAVFILPKRATSTPRRFRIRSVESPPAPRVRIENQDGRVRFLSGEREIATYHAAPSLPPPGMEPKFQRSGHLHPVKTPAGRIVTDEFPADHPHQHAIFTAWVNTEFEGRSVDFWNQGKGQGTVEHRRMLEMTDGPVFAELRTELTHLDLTAPGNPKPALYEVWTVRCFATSSGHFLELESAQRCAGDSSLTIREYHYGGMALRGAGEWLGQAEHDFLTSDGKTRSDGNETRARWVSMHGLLEGHPASLTAFSHPGNFRSPQPVRLHPQKPYFVFAPEVLGEFQITPTAPYVSRYLFLAEDASPDAEHLDDVWTLWAR